MYMYPKSQRTEIVAQLQSIYPLFYEDEDFFTILNEMGTLINIFYYKSGFSTTDCVTTRNSIWKLFDPIIIGNFPVEKSSELQLLLKQDSNIYQFRLHASGIYHTFVLINHDNKWYLIQSYSNIYEMMMIENDDLPKYLCELLDTHSGSLYDSLFKANLEMNKVYGLFYEVIVGKYTEIPIQKLKDLISSYIKCIL
jgi:hypothetical protein